MNQKHFSSYWTRTGWVRLPFGPFDDVEQLTLNEAVREQAMALGMGFSAGREMSHQMAAPWRYGLLLMGRPGTGKTSFTRALSLLTELPHVVIAEREILDHHSLTVALSQTLQAGPAVVLLQDIDRIFTRVSERDFFTCWDAATLVGDGFFWCASTAVPEDIPKQLLMRPGRFDEMLRLLPPNAEVRNIFFKKHLAPFFSQPTEAASAFADDFLRSLVAESEGFTFAHLVELRARALALHLRGNQAQITDELKAYCRDQRIAGDRYGRYSREEEELKERIQHMDPRILAAALHVTDAFKKVVDGALSAHLEEKSVEIQQ